MGGLTDTCHAQANGAWEAATSLPDRYAAWKKGPSIGGRAQRGCLGVLLFGVVYVFLPLLVFLFVEMALIVYALVTGLLWGIGAAVDGAIARRRG